MKIVHLMSALDTSALRLNSKLLLFGIALSVGLGACRAERERVQSDLSGGEILARTADRYANASVYEDRGGVVLNEPRLWRLFKLLSRGEYRETFTTSFTRSQGGTFRYQPRDGGPKFASFAPGALGDSLAGLVGVTHGASYVVPEILIEGRRARTLLADPLRETDSTCQRRKCFVVSGYDQRGYACRMLIDTEQFVIRRIERKLKVRGTEVGATIEYDSVFIR